LLPGALLVAAAFLLAHWGALAHAAPPAAALPDSSDAALRAQRLVLFLNAATVIAFAVWWWRGRRRPDNEAARMKTEADHLRAGLLPHLARWMSTEVFHRMASHREALAKSQQQAEADMAQLEARLARVHAPLEERLQTYEKRIAELESDLAARNAENRELIEAKIHLARKKLASERQSEPSDSPRRHGEHRETSSSSS
jgi:hypothetical protein